MSVTRTQSIILAICLALLLTPASQAQVLSPDFVPPAQPMSMWGLRFNIPWYSGSFTSPSEFEPPPNATAFEFQHALEFGVQASTLFWPTPDLFVTGGLHWNTSSWLSTETTLIQGGQEATIHRDLSQQSLLLNSELGYTFSSFELDGQYGLAQVGLGANIALARMYSVRQSLVQPVFSDLGTESEGNTSSQNVFAPYIGVQGSLFLRRLFAYPIRLSAQAQAQLTPEYAGSTVRRFSFGIMADIHLRTEATRVVDTVFVRDTTSRYTSLLDTTTFELIHRSEQVDSALDEGRNVHLVRTKIEESWLQLIPKPPPLLAADIHLSLLVDREHRQDSLQIELARIVRTVTIPVFPRIFFTEQDNRTPLGYTSLNTRLTPEQLLLRDMNDSLKQRLSTLDGSPLVLTSVNPDPGTVRQRRDAAVARANIVSSTFLTRQQTPGIRVESSLEQASLLKYSPDDQRLVGINKIGPNTFLQRTDTMVSTIGAELLVTPTVFTDVGIRNWSLFVHDSRTNEHLAIVSGNDMPPPSIEVNLEQLAWLSSVEEGKLEVWMEFKDNEEQELTTEPQFVNITPKDSTSGENIRIRNRNVDVYCFLEPSLSAFSKASHSYARTYLQENPHANVRVEVFSTRLADNTQPQTVREHILKQAPYLSSYLTESSQVSIKERPTAFTMNNAVGRLLASCFVIHMTSD